MAGGLRPIASAPIASLPASTSRGVPETIFGADLVHWYRDGWTGTEVVDLIDAANNMTADTGREPSAGSVNGHVTADFPGVDDLVAAGDVTTMDGATELTVFGAFNASPGQGAYATIIGKLYSGYGFHVGANSTGDRLIAAVGSDVTSGFEASSDADPFDDTWHRFIVTWTGSGGTGTCTIYLDGVAQTVVGTVTDAAVPDVSDLLSMGGATFNNTSLFDFFFAGEIANVGIAIRAATSGEVSDLDDYLSDWISGAALSDMTSVAANGVATTTAQIRGTGRLTSTAAAGVATTTAQIRGTGTLTSVAANGVATTTATGQALAPLTSVAANGVATTTATIGAVTNLTSVAANGVATTTANIVGTGRLTSTAAAGVATTTAQIRGTGTLTSTPAAGVATTTANIGGTGRLTSVAANGVATTTANIGATTNMAGSAAGTSTTTANIIATLTIVLVRQSASVLAGVRLGAVVHAGAANDTVVAASVAHGARVHAGASDEVSVHAGARHASRVEGAA